MGQSIFQSTTMRQATLQGIILGSFLMLTAATAQATPIIYSFTSDDLVLNNPHGTWGGSLNVGAGQDVNLTVAFTFEGDPVMDPYDPNGADFYLIGLQLFDNTNGLVSDLLDLRVPPGVPPIPPYASFLRITYDELGALDRIRGAALGTPGGGFFQYDPNDPLVGQFGRLGDPLPTGRAFDRRIERFDIELFARAPDFYYDNITGSGDCEPNPGNDGACLVPGRFTFHSTPVPEPSSLMLLGIGLAGLGWMGRRRKRLKVDRRFALSANPCRWHNSFRHAANAPK